MVRMHPYNGASSRNLGFLVMHHRPWKLRTDNQREEAGARFLSVKYSIIYIPEFVPIFSVISALRSISLVNSLSLAYVFCTQPYISEISFDVLVMKFIRYQRFCIACIRYSLSIACIWNIFMMVFISFFFDSLTIYLFSLYSLYLVPAVLKACKLKNLINQNDKSIFIDILVMHFFDVCYLWLSFLWYLFVSLRLSSSLSSKASNRNNISLLLYSLVIHVVSFLVW